MQTTCGTANMENIFEINTAQNESQLNRLVEGLVTRSRDEPIARMASAGRERYLLMLNTIKQKELWW